MINFIKKLFLVKINGVGFLRISDRMINELKMPLSKYLIVIVCIVISGAKAKSQTNFNVTVFGTQTISADQIREQYSKMLTTLQKEYEANKDAYHLTRKHFANQLLKRGDFSYVNVYLLKSYINNISFIIDFVERQEAVARMRFRNLKTLKLGDPANLIAKWQEYETLSFQLFKQGEIRDMECPVYHCIWAFNHPKLQPYLEYFSKHVPNYEKDLIEILHQSNVVRYRANAAFLLAHSKVKAQELANVLMPAINDPESRVRNNVMRVIYYLVRNQKGVKVNLDKVIQALNYPSFTDRNKALVILRSLPLYQVLSKARLKRVLPVLIEILEKKDGHNFRNAHQVLKNISGEKFTYDDIGSWQQWIKQELNK
ncbi:hypothetical protein BKI52_31530 [marine bacterium AO1-C]|nr:hypothetical protein BKI52_31530 [marine bacterium AO1-C]